MTSGSLAGHPSSRCGEPDDPRERAAVRLGGGSDGQSHVGQVDGCGEPYIDHLKRTATHLVRLFPDATRVKVEAAVLNDVSEDRTRPRRRSSPPASHRHRSCVTGSTSALRVKLADNADNRDPRRVTKPNSLRRVARKYDPAAAILAAEIAYPRNIAAGWIKWIASTAPECPPSHVL